MSSPRRTEDESSCRDLERFAEPTLGMMEKWLQNGQYDCFRKVFEVGAQKCLEDNAAALLTMFQNDVESPDDDDIDWMFVRHVEPSFIQPRLKLDGLRFLLEELRLPRAAIQTQLDGLLLQAVVLLDVEKASICLRAGANPNAPAQTTFWKAQSSLHALIETILATDGRFPGVTRPPSFTDERSERVVGMAQLLCDHATTDVHCVDDNGRSPIAFLLERCGCFLTEEANQLCSEDNASAPPVFPKPGKRSSPYDQCATRLLAILIRRGAHPLPRSSSVPHLLIKGFSALWWRWSRTEQVCMP